ncbi:MAG: haloacid dehalogenase-like hydrolase, partial [Clostridia bacterium]|nr:haloacid dehalogenase-like hydrolase [Clostridia bacterium]
MKKMTIAICYDFDKTLTIDDMQSFAFIPNLGMTTAEFWNKTNNFIKKNGCDVTLGFLRTMLDECRKKGIVLSREYLKEMGKNIPFAEGVLTWFKRLNNFAEKHGATLEHYIISSGNKEMIEGTKIFKEFTNVFACEYLYDKNGEAFWPKNAVNYTTKTQCLFRICKGAHDISDEHTVNRKTEKKHVEFRNMIYIGDGVTDIPCMTLVKEKGGTAIA